MLNLLKKKEYIESEEYLETVLNLPEFSEQKALLKSKQEVYAPAEATGYWMAGGSFAFSVVGFVTVLSESSLSDMIVDFWESAEDDWYWAKDQAKKKKEEESLEIKY